MVEINGVTNYFRDLAIALNVTNIPPGATATVTLLASIQNQAPITLSRTGAAATNTITIYLVSQGDRTIQLRPGVGNLFNVGSNVRLNIGGDSSGVLTLSGVPGNDRALIYISNSFGTLVLNSNTILTGNHNSGGGGAVRMDAGNMIMNEGAVIKGNSASPGGGVHVFEGTFTMNSGIISGNTSSSNFGGGVAIAGRVGTYEARGTFNMHGGTIEGNNAMNGGGVHKNTRGTFTMTGGTIIGNTANGGGGVYLWHENNNPSTDSWDRTNISGGVIEGNTSNSPGGGVYTHAGILTLSGRAEIVGNTTTANGGGIWMNGHVTIQQNTVIMANIAERDGGGVFIQSGNFAFSNIEAAQIVSNIATTGNGAGIFARVNFGMGLNARVNTNNDVFLANTGTPTNIQTRQIDINGNLSEIPTGMVARIKLPIEAYTENRQVLGGTTGQLISNNYDRFELVQPENGPRWRINNTGRLELH
jgi:hypothetical protein